MIKKRFVVTAECAQRARHLELKSQDIGMNKLFVKTHKKTRYPLLLSLAHAIL